MAQIEVHGVNLVADEFERYPRRAQRIIVRALDRGGNAADTLMSRAIAKDVGLKVADVKKALRRRRPTLSEPEFTMAARFRRIPLIKFSARGPRPSRGRGRGVSYNLGEGGGRNRIANAFIATVRRAGQDGEHSGHEGVFVRVGKGRLPIKQRYGPSLGKVFAKYRAEALARGMEVFETTLNHELERAGAND
jgi:hypothetical protein